MRLIDADALSKEMDNLEKKYGIGSCGDGITICMEAVDKAPTIDSFGSWIPVTFRNMTEQEAKEMEEEFGMTLQEDEKVMFNCPMPENDQEILVCTKWGHIYIDRVEYDPDYGYGLESNGDWDGITAWMSLPKPYEVKNNE